ncbi:hypothetical protein HDU93_001045, partial [Gonapodya sp. JEL0774]
MLATEEIVHGEQSFDRGIGKYDGPWSALRVSKTSARPSRALLDMPVSAAIFDNFVSTQAFDPAAAFPFE